MIAIDVLDVASGSFHEDKGVPKIIQLICLSRFSEFSAWIESSLIVTPSMSHHSMLKMLAFLERKAPVD